MFERALSLGDTRSSIVLQTARGNSIENSIEPEPGEQAKAKFENLIKKFGARWIVRRPVTGRYNCAGLVFANRRTSIFEPRLYVQILEDDGYRKLASPTQLRESDVAAYVDRASEEIHHLALIMRLEAGVGPSPVAFALSKWDSAMGEVLHNVYASPYDLTQDYRLDFWTDRPPEMRRRP